MPFTSQHLCDKRSKKVLITKSMGQWDITETEKDKEGWINILVSDILHCPWCGQVL